MAINSEVYVDKIEMMVILNSFLNTNKRYVSVSRPRRFGKTMSADMICAYYDRSANSRILFESTKLAASDPVRTGRGELAWDGFLGKFDVVRLVMTNFFKMGKSVDSGLALLNKRLLGELSETYPHVHFDEDDLAYSMGRFYQATGTQLWWSSSMATRSKPRWNKSVGETTRIGWNTIGETRCWWPSAAIATPAAPIPLSSATHASLRKRNLSLFCVVTDGARSRGSYRSRYVTSLRSSCSSSHVRSLGSMSASTSLVRFSVRLELPRMKASR